MIVLDFTSEEKILIGTDVPGLHWRRKLSGGHSQHSSQEGILILRAMWPDLYRNGYVSVFETEQPLRTCQPVNSWAGPKNRVLRNCICKNPRVV